MVGALPMTLGTPTSPIKPLELIAVEPGEKDVAASTNGNYGTPATERHVVRSNYTGLTGPPWAHPGGNHKDIPPSQYDEQLAAVMGQHGGKLGRSDACADYVGATLAYGTKG